MRVGLTQEAFDGLLAFLDPDRDRAARKYEDIRRRLLKIFTCRGCAFPEELVDESIDRVAAKSRRLVGVYEGEPALYFYGVARNVAHEYFKKKRAPLDPPPAHDPMDDCEPELDCLERCVEALPPGQRSLILQYYREEKRAKIEARKKLAAELGIGVRALRIRAHRIRAHLTECVRACLERGGPEVASPLVV